MHAAGAGQDGIGRNTRKTFINEVFVGGATAERARGSPRRYCHSCLDEHQRHGQRALAWGDHTEFAAVVDATPGITDATDS